MATSAENKSCFSKMENSGRVEVDTHSHHWTSSLCASANILCVIMGSGIVGLPYAISSIGWAGIAAILLCPVLMGWTAIKLLSVTEVFPDAKRYPDIALACVGPRMKVATIISQLINNFGVTILYLVLAANNMVILTGLLTPQLWVVIFGVSLLPVICIRRMSELTVFSVIGVAASILIISVVIKDDFSLSAATDFEPSNPSAFTFFNGLGVIMFSYSCHSVLPSMVAEYPQPYKTGKRAIYVAFPLIAMLYCTMCTVTYAIIGCQVTSDILQDPLFGHDALFLTVVGAITVHVLIACVLLTSGSMFYLETYMGITVDSFCSTGKLYSVLFRTALMGCFVTVGAFAGNSFGTVINLLGGNNVVICIILPVLFWLRATALGTESEPVELTSITTSAPESALNLTPTVSDTVVAEKLELSTDTVGTKFGGSTTNKCERYFGMVVIAFGAFMAAFITFSAIYSAIVTSPTEGFPLCFSAAL